MVTGNTGTIKGVMNALDGGGRFVCELDFVRSAFVFLLSLILVFACFKFFLENLSSSVNVLKIGHVRSRCVAVLFFFFFLSNCLRAVTLCSWNDKGKGRGKRCHVTYIALRFIFC